MRKYILLIVFFIIILQVKAQDIIVLKKCEKVKAKNILVDASTIIYCRYDDPANISDTISLEKVCMIKYASGEKKYFTEDTLKCRKCLLIAGWIPKNDSGKFAIDTKIITDKLDTALTRTGNVVKKEKKEIDEAVSKVDSAHEVKVNERKSEWYLKGVEDAKRNYKSRAPFWTTLTITAVPLMAGAGMVTGIVFACNKPSDSNIMKSVPDKSLLQNELYMKGFKHKARTKKITKTLLGFGIGIVVETVGILIMQKNGMLPEGSGTGGGDGHDD